MYLSFLGACCYTMCMVCNLRDLMTQRYGIIRKLTYVTDNFTSLSHLFQLLTIAVQYGVVLLASSDKCAMKPECIKCRV